MSSLSNLFVIVDLNLIFFLIFLGNWHKMMWQFVLVWLWLHPNVTFSAFSHRHVSLGFLGLSLGFILFYIFNYAYVISHYAWEWPGGPGEDQGSVWLHTMSLADSCCLCYTCWQQYDYYCQDWLWEIYDLLDACSLHQIGNFHHCHSLKAVRVTVCPNVKG